MQFVLVDVMSHVTTLYISAVTMQFVLVDVMISHITTVYICSYLCCRLEITVPVGWALHTNN